MIRYTNEPAASGASFDGAICINLRLNNKETRVPAFDCSELNQCTGSDVRKLCEGPQPKPALQMERFEENGFRFEGKVENMPESEIAAWVWDFPMAQPSEPFYEGQRIESHLQRAAGPVRLTAISNKGCFGVVQENL